MFARVVVLAPVRAPQGDEPAFDYAVPDDLPGTVEAGSLVTVPLRTRPLYAIVIDLPEQPAVPDTKPLTALVDPAPVLSPAHIETARWMSRETLAPLHECLLAMLPPGVVGMTDSRLEVTPGAESVPSLSALQRLLVDLLVRRGPLLGRQLDRAFPHADWRSAADRLVQRGVLIRSSILAPPRASPKQVHTVRLVAEADLEVGLARLRSPVYEAVVEFLRGEGTAVDVSWVYAQTGCSRYHLDRLQQRGVVVFDTEEVWRDPLEGKVFLPTAPPPLTPDQQAAWEAVEAILAGGAVPDRAFLLHGVTGSGKTEIYLRAVAEVLEQGRKAIVLVPEVSLTPQTVARFAARFPGRVTLVHSQLTDGERYDVWRRARAGLVDVVVGPRSALFTPLSPLGLIVLDEEHDPSYKQQSRPSYHARETALQLAGMTGATVILGSATASLESALRAQRGEFHLLTLERRILGHTRRLSDLQTVYRVFRTRFRPLEDGAAHARYVPLPPVKVVDMRAELRAGNRSIFSRTLAGALDQTLAKGEQAILFLNRRGTATFVLCRDCGLVSRCPACDVPLVVHHHQARLICHHCGHQETPPARCPRCDGTRIRRFGLGTEGVEEVVRESWPEARLLRWDRDTARTAEAHWSILQRFSDGQADVLVGTQMIAKGLDLPLVTLVGVVSADTALNLPDFRCAERTFQLLEQVAGRAGRGLRGGQVVIQTYHPDHYAIRAVEQHDYQRFAQEELAFRRQLDYPPFVRLARLLYRHPDAQQARVAAMDLAEQLRQALRHDGLPRTDLIGPAPAFYQRLHGRYRWHILLRHRDPPAFLRAADIPRGWRVDVDPVSVL